MALLLAAILVTTLRAGDSPRARARREESTTSSPLDRLKRRDAEHRLRSRVGQWSVPSPTIAADSVVPNDRSTNNERADHALTNDRGRYDRFGGWQGSRSILDGSPTESLLESHRKADSTASSIFDNITTTPTAPTAPTTKPRISSRLEPDRLKQQVTEPPAQVRPLFADEVTVPVTERPASLFDSELPSPLFEGQITSLDVFEVPEPQPEIAREAIVPSYEPVREFRPIQSDVPTTLRTPDVEPLLNAESRLNSGFPSNTLPIATPSSLFNEETIPSATSLFEAGSLDIEDVAAPTSPLPLSDDEPVGVTAENEFASQVAVAQTTELAPSSALPAATTPATPTKKNRTDFVPIPLAAIRPYHDYSPGNRPHCRPGQPGCPDLVPIPAVGTFERDFIALDYMWEPSNLFHNPLYFEDPELERYGHTSGQLFQPIASIGRFGVQLAGLPYQIAIEPVARDVSILGHHRPGEAVPARLNQIPWNLDAALGAGLFYTGLSFIP